MRVLVIVPAYNEARHLPELAQRLLAVAGTYDVCVVDDGSSDGTAAIEERAGLTVLRSSIKLLENAEHPVDDSNAQVLRRK